MAENNYLTEARALRALIEEYHRRDECHALANLDTDGPALRKFHAYCGQLFSDAQRTERLSAIGILVGRHLDSTMPGLTLGEVLAFLTWFDGGPGFRVRPGASRLMLALRNSRETRVFMRIHLGKVELRRVYNAKEEQKDNATWVSVPTHQNGVETSF